MDKKGKINGSYAKTFSENIFRCKYIFPFSIKITVLLFRSSVLLVTDALMLKPRNGSSHKYILSDYIVPKLKFGRIQMGYKH